MKKIFLILGIVLLIIGVGSLFAAALHWFAFKSVLDASNAFYHTKYKLAVRFLIIGVMTALIGLGCVIVSANCLGKN